MHIDRKRFTGVKISKNKTKKIGTRSISDIIHNTPELNFIQKVNYIRHKYSYYNGNYELFHTNKGKPNSKKFKLNYLITEILLGKKDPNELKQFNKQILKWRKEYNEKKNNELEKLYKNISVEKYNLDILTDYENMSWNKYNKIRRNKDEIIDEYLKYNKHIIKPEVLETIKYKDLKNIALKWNKGYNTNTSTNKLDNDIDYQDVTSMEEYVKRLSRGFKDSVKPYLPLILMYLESESDKYTLEELKTKKYKNMKNIATNWAAYKKANNEEIDETNLPDLVKDIINKKAENIIKQRDIQIIAKLKNYALDLEKEKNHVITV